MAVEVLKNSLHIRLMAHLIHDNSDKQLTPKKKPMTPPVSLYRVSNWHSRFVRTVSIISDEWRAPWSMQQFENHPEHLIHWIVWNFFIENNFFRF